MSESKKKHIQSVKALLGDDVPESVIEQVLAAQLRVADGDKVGTVRRDEKTGSVAHRVSENGGLVWRVSSPDGDVYNDLQSTLAWPVIHAVE